MTLSQLVIHRCVRITAILRAEGNGYEVLQNSNLTSSVRWLFKVPARTGLLYTVPGLTQRHILRHSFPYDCRGGWGEEFVTRADYCTARLLCSTVLVIVARRLRLEWSHAEYASL